MTGAWIPRRLGCALLGAWLLASSSPLIAASPAVFEVVRIDTRIQTLELFFRDEAGVPYRRLPILADALAHQHRRLGFAMNAGMFHPDLAPVGLLVTEGDPVAPLNLGSGWGNFYMKPNGVFFVDAHGPRVVESSTYPSLAQPVRQATQSGPLLVMGGVINAAFHPASTSRRIHNGVGVSGSQALFVISNQPVTFFEIASYFRDVLRCNDALYLDGSVSSLYSPALGRADSVVDLGPILGVTD